MVSNRVCPYTNQWSLLIPLLFLLYPFLSQNSRLYPPVKPQFSKVMFLLFFSFSCNPLSINLEVLLAFPGSGCFPIFIAPSVLDFSGCYNKMPQTPWLIDNRNLFPTVLRAKVRDQGAAWLLSGEPVLFWVHSWHLLAASSHGRRGWGPLWGVSDKNTNSTHEVPHDLSTSQRSHLWSPSSLGVRISTCEFWGTHTFRPWHQVVQAIITSCLASCVNWCSGF